jgi:hypothetical protein
LKSISIPKKALPKPNVKAIKAAKIEAIKEEAAA